MLSGADVSVYQGNIQWDAFAPQLDFVFIRATYGTQTVDKKFAYNRAEAARCGLLRGYYHYALPRLGAAEQAQKICSVVGDLEPGELDIVLDLEEMQHEGKVGHVWAPEDTLALQEWTRVFVREVKARYPGRSVILYTRHNFWHERLGGCSEFVDCPLWIANYTYGLDSVRARPPASTKEWADWAHKKPLKAWDPWSAWSFWQITAKAVMPGVRGNTVDANLYNGTLSDLRRLARLEEGPVASAQLPTADALCQKLLSQTEDRYIYGHEVRLTDPNPSAFDCSELIEWGCAQLGVKPAMPDGSWVQARHVRAARLLMPVQTAIATRGALLFRFSGDPFAGGRPKHAHVALSLGDGRTIEARDTAHGVGVFPALERGWTHAGRIPGIDYGAAPPGRGLARGAKGPEVKAWQQHLLKWRAGVLPRFGVDGEFGAETEAATRIFQQEMGLPVTGAVGPETRDALQRALPRPPCALDLPRALGRALLGVVDARAPAGGALSTAGPQGDLLGAASRSTAMAPPGAEGTAMRSYTFVESGFRFTVTATPEPVAAPRASDAGGAVAFFAVSDPSTRAAAHLAPVFDGTGLEWLPPRDPAAMTGTQFYEQARGLSLAAREELFVQEVLRGNVPAFLRRFHRVTVEAPDGKRGVAHVCADYLAVGSDTDFLRMPLTGVTAQRIADACGCVLPTKKLVKDIYAASRKQTAIPFSPDDGTRIERFREHHLAIEQRRVGELGELLAGHKKDIVVTNRLHHHARRLALYGFHKADSKPWQPLDTSLRRRLPHEDTYADYSHGVRLIGGLISLGPEQRCAVDVLLDQGLCGLLSDEGIISVPRYEVRPLG
ncbi:GH25 family lysozyme [Sorangium sp. So ce1389]|uniref:GH25 family lysozyme n=1 Tax=Sorangium sp. So ce1389 TaxID=3133336 RepID=UPI003F61705D